MARIFVIWDVQSTMLARLLPLALVGLGLGTGCGASNARANGVDTTVEKSARPAESALAVTIRPSTDPAHHMIGSVGAVHAVATKDPFDVRVYETHVGDPVNNGDLLWMSVSAPSRDGAMFDLGLDILKLTTVESLGGGKYAIKGTRSKTDEKGEHVTEPFEATVELVVEDARIKGVVVTQPDGSKARIDPSKVAGADSTARVHKVTTKADGGVLASVYELGNDTALNRAHLFLNLLVHPAVWAIYDLELDVATLSSMSLANSGGEYTIELEGLRDTAPGQSEPFRKTIKFAIGDGPPGAIEMR